MPTITGTGQNDTLSGSTDNDTILALGGNDVINISRGMDSVDGGEGADTLQVADGALAALGLAAGTHRYTLSDGRFTDAGGIIDTRFSNVETITFVDRSGSDVQFTQDTTADQRFNLELGRGNHIVNGIVGIGSIYIVATIENTSNTV